MIEYKCKPRTLANRHQKAEEGFIKLRCISSYQKQKHPLFPKEKSKVKSFAAPQAILVTFLK